MWGSRGVLVHNDEGCPSGNEVKKKNTKVNKPGLEAGVNKGKVVNLMDNSFEKLENVIDPVEADHIYPKNAIDKDFSVKMKELTPSQKKQFMKILKIYNICEKHIMLVKVQKQ